MVQSAAAFYSQSQADVIRYHFDGGRWLDVSEAVFTGDRQLQRIAVKYLDGTCVVANGHKTKRIEGEIFGRRISLPPGGYAVWRGDGSLEVESGDSRGVRVDYCAAEDVCYLDTRSAQKSVAFGKARGKGIAVCRREGGGWEVIPVRGDVAFRIPGIRARALDEDRRDLGAAQIVRDADGFAQIAPVAGAFSYIVE
jgi:hypothetical protein